jgi:hypothetical protein
VAFCSSASVEIALAGSFFGQIGQRRQLEFVAIEQGGLGLALNALARLGRRWRCRDARRIQVAQIQRLIIVRRERRIEIGFGCAGATRRWQRLGIEGGKGRTQAGLASLSAHPGTFMELRLAADAPGRRHRFAAMPAMMGSLGRRRLRQTAQDHAAQRHGAMREPADQDHGDAGLVVAAVLALRPGFVGVV